MNTPIYITAAKRTPIGSFLGSLQSLSSKTLATPLVQPVLTQANLTTKQIDEMIIGNVLQAGQGQNIARQIAKETIGIHTPAYTVNKVCGSGLKSIILAAQSIQCGDANVILAGGTESMSNAPFLLERLRQGYKMGNQSLIDSMIKDGLWDNFNDYHMGITAENIAEKFDISRETQDRFSVHSQQKAEKAIQSGLFSEEIVPISIPQRKTDPLVIDTDEFPRSGCTYEQLSKLRPVFKSNGSVTAGNASGINDGAALISLSNEHSLKQSQTSPLARIVSYASSGVDPSIMGIGPITAIQIALKKAQWSVNDVDLIESNEAFAVQSCAVAQALHLPEEKLNVNGGAIALGHPIGASGTRIVVTLLYEMQRRNAKRGLAALCIGGGMGIALCIERD